MSNKLNIMVAGAGIGGLTAAACLMSAGHKVRIYEVAPELGEVGAGIQSSANAVKVFLQPWLERRVREGHCASKGV